MEAAIRVLLQMRLEDVTLAYIQTETNPIKQSCICSLFALHPFTIYTDGAVQSAPNEASALLKKQKKDESLKCHLYLLRWFPERFNSIKCECYLNVLLQRHPNQIL